MLRNKEHISILKKQVARIGICVCIVAVALVSGWWVYEYFYGVPEGPALPAQAPDKEYAQQAIELNNEAVTLHLTDRAKALALYEKAIGIDPTYHLAYANKATLLLEDRRYQEAAECFDTLVSLRPRAAEYYVGQALCLQRLGEQKEAYNSLLHALSAYNYRLDSDPIHARLNRALVLFLMDRKAVARKQLEKLKRSNADMSKMLEAVLGKMKEVEDSDPWLVLGLDD